MHEGRLKEKESDKERDKRKNHDRYVFLFNDLLLVSAAQKGINVGFGSAKPGDFSQAIFTYKYSFDFHSVEIAEVPAAEEEGGGKKKGKVFGFVITKNHRKYLLLFFLYMTLITSHSLYSQFFYIFFLLPLIIPSVHLSFSPFNSLFLSLISQLSLPHSLSLPTKVCPLFLLFRYQKQADVDESD